MVKQASENDAILQSNISENNSAIRKAGKGASRNESAYLTPAITLFREDGSLDLESQGRLFDNLIEKGIDGILVEGSSSEFFAMPMDERREMARFAIERVDHRVKLIIGTSSMVADEIPWTFPTTAWSRARTQS